MGRRFRRRRPRRHSSRPRRRIKNWLKLIIFGVILFFVGVAFVQGIGSTFGEVGFYGLISSFLGLLLIGFGFLMWLSGFWNRGVRE